ncbi:MAG: hypothetical protein M3295_07230 [Chloroflexota bacterium]|nr:hypothetical protein [Chloroflexota bacterium]
MIIRPDRREQERRRPGEGPPAGVERRQSDRRTMCWEVEQCDLTIRYRCPAFILRRPCWELWAVEGVGPARACCYNDKECEPGRCVIAEKHLADRQPLPVHVGRRGVPLGYGRPRRHHCPHFYLTSGGRGAIPIQAPQLMRQVMKQEGTVARCELRGGVHLDSGYVSDLCLSSQFNQCVFYEDDRE